MTEVREPPEIKGVIEVKIAGPLKVLWVIEAKNRVLTISLNGDTVATDIAGNEVVDIAYKQMLLQIGIAFKKISGGT